MTQVSKFFQFVALGVVLMGIGYSFGALVTPYANRGMLSCITGETGDTMCRHLVRLDR